MLSLIDGIGRNEATEIEIQMEEGTDPTEEQTERWLATGIKLCPVSGFPCDCLLFEPDQRCDCWLSEPEQESIHVG